MDEQLIATSYEKLVIIKLSQGLKKKFSVTTSIWLIFSNYLENCFNNMITCVKYSRVLIKLILNKIVIKIKSKIFPKK